ncbi:nucleotidyltransferase domain-containing protein [Mesorhizobium sp. VK9D]|uniref:nucleotidyltransferase domain-containing protein n=1 Tax=Mesorhizobium australafricanum TaxID=3072311 RepID=UPI002A2425B6|nr:nucleotidyltransferase domain-containing protein [Mesorhizobium sp. VK9D]MDX8451500.1 nucleotidyltransferase domain-containing protein [Mesorhizobium sp. VK9D]
MGNLSKMRSVPVEIQPLIDAIKVRLNPESIWLFGSRARGDGRPDSDWDILVALPDDAEPGLLDPLVAWAIKNEIGIPATILSTKSGELAASWDSKNTIAYDIARNGYRLDV